MARHVQQLLRVFVYLVAEELYFCRQVLVLLLRHPVGKRIQLIDHVLVLVLEHLQLLAAHVGLRAGCFHLRRRRVPRRVLLAQVLLH